MLNKIVLALLSSVLIINAASSETWRDELPNAMLVGKGNFRWLFFDIYSAKLWSEHLPFDSNSPFALELTYHRHITTKQFVKSSIDEIKRIQGTTHSAEEIRQWEKKLATVFPDVHDGDQLIGVYLPNQGCVFFDKNRQLATINDTKLAKAFFAIWLDKRTRDERLRSSLLGEKSE